MRKYKLYIEGASYIDNEGNVCNYKITTSRNSKRATETYGKNVTITDLHDKIISQAILVNGKGVNVEFDPYEFIKVKKAKEAMK